jgi:hypothetical protein
MLYVHRAKRGEKNYRGIERDTLRQLETLGGVSEIAEPLAITARIATAFLLLGQGIVESRDNVSLPNATYFCINILLRINAEKLRGCAQHH